MNPETYVAFVGHVCVAQGTLPEVATSLKLLGGPNNDLPALLFEDATGRQLDIDLRGTLADVLARLPEPISPAPAAETAPEESRGPGRPRLGVTPREVTLLPRHWEWLATQPGGASVALRKLVEEARRKNTDKDRKRQSQEAAYRFMAAMAGDFVGFEEASRALYGGDRDGFDAHTSDWPLHVRNYAQRLASGAFGNAD